MTPDQQEALAALLRRPRVARLFAALDGDGAELRIVGGAVRDALLGLNVDEIDLAISVVPEETVARASRAGLKSIPTGIDHGTVTVLVEGEPFEITSLREDVLTNGRHAVVRYGKDFDADARRRDFTINALSLDGRGRLHDPVGGYADLGAPAGAAGGAAGGAGTRIRFIGDARTRIREDYLRSLRFFRFVGRFGASAADAQGFAATIAGRDGLSQLSAERVRAELLKVLASDGAAHAITLMAGAGLLHAVSGIVAEPGRLARLIARQRAAGDGPDPLLRLAAVAVRVREDAALLGRRLRLSGAETTRLTALARVMEAMRSARRVDLRQLRALVAIESVAAVADACALLAPDDDGAVALTLEARAGLAQFTSGAEAQPQLPVRGADLLEMGLAAGPQMGALTRRLRQQWLADGCPTGPDARAALLEQARTLNAAGA